MVLSLIGIALKLPQSFIDPFGLASVKQIEA